MTKLSSKKPLATFLFFWCMAPWVGRAQFSAQAELLKGLSSRSPGIYAGPSLQYHRKLFRDIYPGISAGFLYSLMDGKNTESFSVPMLLLVRYYAGGYHGRGGSEYIEILSGCNLDYHKSITSEGSEATSSLILNSGMTMGYHLPGKYDFGVRWGMLLREVKPLFYLGVKAGYAL